MPYEPKCSYCGETIVAGDYRYAGMHAICFAREMPDSDVAKNIQAGAQCMPPNYGALEDDVLED